ncbi:MAG: hypothetical protein AB7U73_11825 [Pirellulales bacterium]
MPVLVVAVDRPEIPPCEMPDRFRHDVAYFMSVPGEGGVPALPEGEYWIDLSRARTWLDDGVFSVVSPLDSASRTEVELTDEQESWLNWLVAHNVERVRLTR